MTASLRRLASCFSLSWDDILPDYRYHQPEDTQASCSFGLTGGGDDAISVVAVASVLKYTLSAAEMLTLAMSRKVARWIICMKEETGVIAAKHQMSSENF